MKAVLSVLLFILYSNPSFCELIDRNKYQIVAEKKIEEFNSNGGIFKKINTPRGLYENDFQGISLNAITIPIFEFKQDKYYNCGDNIDSLISIINDPYFQLVILVDATNKRMGYFGIYDSYNERRGIRDSIKQVEYPDIHGRIVYNESKSIEKKIVKFIHNNPSLLVFMIKGLDGYWFLENGEIEKIINSLFKLRGVDGSKYICQNYGEDYINHTINEEFRTGYIYESCDKCR